MTTEARPTRSGWQQVAVLRGVDRRGRRAHRPPSPRRRRGRPRGGARGGQPARADDPGHRPVTQRSIDNDGDGASFGSPSASSPGSHSSRPHPAARSSRRGSWRSPWPSSPSSTSGAPGTRPVPGVRGLHLARAAVVDGGGAGDVRHPGRRLLDRRRRRRDRLDRGRVDHPRLGPAAGDRPRGRRVGRRSGRSRSPVPGSGRATSATFGGTRSSTRTTTASTTATSWLASRCC